MSTRQQGFSLLEVLVAMVILAVGLLGIAGMQASSMRNVHSGYLRSQATLLSYDIFERMRANPELARAGSYDIAIGANSAGTDINQLDLITWKANLAATLPNGDGSVVVANNGVATVVVRWTERVANEEGNAAEGNYRVDTRDFETQSVL